jgi:methionyl-tRNA formyltransferase
VALAARELGLPLEQPDSINGAPARGRIAAAAPGAVCVCAFGALIKEPLLSQHELLNVHPSLLPRWRGAAPIERAVMAGDDFTGVSIMRLTAGLDNGPLCAQGRERIEARDTYGSLGPRLADLGGELLVDVLDQRPRCSEQDDSVATYAEKITARDRELSPARPAEALGRTVRALTPHIGAYLLAQDGTRLGVREARAVVSAEVAAGVLSLDGPLPRFGTVDGALELILVQPPGGRPMPGEDYLRGHRR